MIDKLLKIQRWRHRAALKTLRLFPPDNYKKKVLIAGVGRSGTTWITNIINFKKNYRIIFEPVHSDYVPGFEHFSKRQYIRPDNADPKYREPMEKLFAGDICSSWSDSRLNAFFPRNLLIKDIRANLLLPWIHRHHPDVKLILVLRHPYDVYLSKKKLGWGPGLSLYLAQPDLVGDHLTPYLDFMSKVLSDMEGIVTGWCIENMVPMRQIPAGSMLICHYEHFIRDPRREVNRVMKFLNESADHVPDSIFRASSDTNWNKTDHTNFQHGRAMKTGWEDADADLPKVQEILTVFGMNHLYGPDRNPLYSAAEE